MRFRAGCFFAVVWAVVFGSIAILVVAILAATDAEAQTCNEHYNQWYMDVGYVGNTIYNSSSAGLCAAAGSYFDSQCYKQTADPGCNTANATAVETSGTAGYCSVDITANNGQQFHQDWPFNKDTSGEGCPEEPEECDPAYSGDVTASADESSVPVGTSRCGQTSHCVLTKVRGDTVSGGTHYLSVWENTGTTCSEGQDAAPPEEPGEKCTTHGSFEVCVNPSGEGKCGYVNGQFVCMKNIQKGGCQVFGDGSRLCESSAGTPPAPDSGTPGQPAAPDEQISQTSGSTTNNYNFYGSGTVAGSSRDPGSSGSPQGSGTNGGAGAGEGVDEESDEEEGTCEGEFCGSALPELEDIGTMTQAYQQFWTDLQGVPIIEAAGSISSSLPSGSCPDWSTAINVFGQEIELDFTSICTLWGNIAPILTAIFLAFWGLLAFRVLFSA